jgi:hypothetical protein
MATGKGLLGLLQKRTQPAIKCYADDATRAAPEDAKLLLVDGAAVLEAVTARLVPAIGHTTTHTTGVSRNTYTQHFGLARAWSCPRSSKFGQNSLAGKKNMSPNRNAFVTTSAMHVSKILHVIQSSLIFLRPRHISA